MGWYLLRREALALLCLLAAAALRGAEELPADEDGPLPALQGHEGSELYSLAIPDEDVIGRYVDGFLAGRRDWLQQVLDRSRGYRVIIAAAVEERGLPRELQFLPALESGFKARAVSPRGAAGLWQLMRNTASPYGLRMDVWVDERRDVRKATAASLSKLKENRRIFGDWYLALAAYNCGAGKLSGILARSPGSDYWALRRKGVLPNETASFVPKFLALCRILSYPGRFGLEVGWDAPPEQDLVPLASGVDLRILSRVTGLPLEILTSGNPELNFPVTPPASYGYELKVPAGQGAAVTRAVADSTVPLMEFRVHVIAAGDTLSAIGQSYGVSVAVIQEFNPKLAPRALPIGARVLIPVLPARSP
jgi:membrane-bound lytic murein transglycosylase D